MLLQDLQAAYMDSVNESLMSDDPNTSHGLPILLAESLRLSHSPAPCLYPSPAVYAICCSLIG